MAMMEREEDRVPSNLADRSDKANVPSFFLCYECGETFQSKPSYDEHILVHQAISFCYQIYEFETKGFQLELTLHDKRNDDNDGKKGNREGSRNAISGSADNGRPVKLSGRRNTVADVPRKRSQADSVPPKRKMTDPLPDSLVCISKKPARSRMSRRSNAGSHSQLSRMAGASTDPSSSGIGTASPLEDSSRRKALPKRASSSRVAQEAQEQSPTTISAEKNISNGKGNTTEKITTAPRLENQQGAHDESRSKDPRTPKYDDDLRKDGKQPSTSPASLKKLSADAVKMQNKVTISVPDVVANAVPAQSSSHRLFPKCLLCDFRSGQGSEMVEHVVHAHKARIIKLEKADYINEVWSKKKSIDAKEECEFCIRRLTEPTDYYLHLIVCHKTNLLLSSSDKYSCTVHLAHHEAPVQKVNITMKRH